MAAAGDVFGTGSEFHGDGGFVDEFTCVSADDVDSKDSIGCFISENFDEAIGLTCGTSSSVRGKTETAGFVFDSSGFLSVFVGSRRSDFR